jgi:hypothetical protein
MKQKTLNKRLVINKITISDLTTGEQGAVRGGEIKKTIQAKSCDCSAPGLACKEGKAAGTIQGRTCDGTIQGRTCDQL